MREDHLLAAKIATVYVSDALPYGPANLRAFEVAPQPGALDRVELLRTDMNHVALELGIFDKPSFQANKGAYFERMAQKALMHRAGNCDAMAAIAYRLLASSPSVKPVVLHSMQKPDRSDAHCFVTINQQVKDAAPSAWSEDEVVVCDPWLSHIHIHFRHVLSDTFDEHELMGAYTVSRHIRFMTELGYYGGSCIELLRAS